MNEARSSRLRFGQREVDFAGTCVTCADVLRKELSRMDEFLHGEVRPEVEEYVGTFLTFLTRWGET